MLRIENTIAVIYISNLREADASGFRTADKILRRTAPHHAFLPLNSGHPEATPLNCKVALSQYGAMYERNVSKFIVCTAKPRTRYKEAVLALENVCVQVSCSQRTRKKCVLAR